MIKNKRVLAWIPARGGSKGIKDKNIKELCGKPLIAYTIEVAKNCSYVDEVFVSTDSQNIADIARNYGAYVPSLRPAELASDTAKTIDAAVYTLDLLKKETKYFDIFVLLQPTSPLRIEKEISGALELFAAHNFEKGVVSVSPSKTSPILIRTMTEDGTLSNLLQTGSTVRRQDMPKFFQVNGAIYINSVSDITPNLSFNDNPLGYEMKEDTSVDIDTIKDFKYAEMLMKANVLKKIEGSGNE